MIAQAGAGKFRVERSQAKVGLVIEVAQEVRVENVGGRTFT